MTTRDVTIAAAGTLSRLLFVCTMGSTLLQLPGNLIARLFALPHSFNPQPHLQS